KEVLAAQRVLRFDALERSGTSGTSLAPTVQNRGFFLASPASSTSSSSTSPDSTASPDSSGCHSVISALRHFQPGYRFSQPARHFGRGGNVQPLRRSTF